MVQIFGTRFWGFGPADFPFAGFTYRGSRDALIRMSSPGDLLVILGTKGEETAPEERGHLLGLIEFERTAASAEDFVTTGEVPAELLDENGQFRWPHAVPALRAWQFTPSREIWSVLGRQLTRAATTGVDQLSTREVNAVLALPRTEVQLPNYRARIRSTRIASNIASKLDPNSPGQPGPAPSEWSAMVAHQDGPTATYLLQFGSSKIWKVGISKNPANRCSALNFSIPVELLKQQWGVKLLHKHENGQDAYAMEQALLQKLRSYSTQNERLLCDFAIVEAAWVSYVAAASR